MSAFDLRDPLRPTIEKDVDANVDYSWDWTAWLAGDTIQSFTVTAAAPLVVTLPTRSGNIVTAFIAGGVADTIRAATCQVVTTGGRTDQRSIYFKLVQR
jgi:hypothetical protein